MVNPWFITYGFMLSGKLPAWIYKLHCPRTIIAIDTKLSYALPIYELKENLKPLKPSSNFTKHDRFTKKSQNRFWAIGDGLTRMGFDPPKGNCFNFPKKLRGTISDAEILVFAGT